MSSSANQGGAAWYRQPVVWLGGIVLVASFAACLWLIVISQDDGAARLITGSGIFGVPTQTGSASAP